MVFVYMQCLGHGPKLCRSMESKASSMTSKAQGTRLGRFGSV